MRSKILKQLLLVLVLFVLAGLNDVFAAGGSIRAVPSVLNPTSGESFDVDIVVNGGGVAFNTAKASITVASNLEVRDLILGNCGFSFVVTPTTSNPSFVGAVLGGGIDSCTAFTLKLKLKDANTGTVTVSDGSIVASSDHSQLISVMQGGIYQAQKNQQHAVNLTPLPVIAVSPSSKSTNSVTNGPIQTELNEYTLLVTYLDANEHPIYGAKVSIANSPATGTTDYNGHAVLAGIQSGVNTLNVQKNNKNVSEIISLSGSNPVVSFSIKDGATTNSLPNPGLTNIAVTPLMIIVGIIIVAVIAEAVILFLAEGKTDRIDL
ncbi:MAG TPA: hypothetical protein VG965_02560 [Patescibacteria group bacterium]|nr:hypothetical protein [Patescibacteria group bacterium]